MKKQTGFEKGWSELLQKARPLIQNIVDGISRVYDNNIINGKGYDSTETIDKSKMTHIISYQLKEYLKHHYVRTFSLFYFKQYSIKKGKNTIINKENWDSFELTDERKSGILQNVFSIPIFLSDLLTNKSGNIMGYLMETEQLLGISRFVNGDLLGKLAAYGNTKKGDPMEQRQIFPQVFVRYYLLYQTENNTTYRKLLKENNYYSENELDKAEGRFKKYVEKFIHTTLQILKETPDNREKPARETAIKNAFRKFGFPDNIPPKIVESISKIIKGRINKEKSKKRNDSLR
jgi:hypothetical protein